MQTPPGTNTSRHHNRRWNSDHSFCKEREKGQILHKSIQMAQGSTYTKRPTNMGQIDLQTDKHHMENLLRTIKVDIIRGRAPDM